MAGKITIKRKVITIMIIALLVFPLYFNLFLDLKLKDFTLPSTYPVTSQIVDNIYTNETPNASQIDLTNLFPLVHKTLEKTELFIEINFTIQNTINRPIHNFTFNYYHLKDLKLEYPINLAVFPESNNFILNTEDLGSRMKFIFAMDSRATISINETYILSLQFLTNISLSELSGDGVEWNCTESIDIGTIYEIADPTQLILDPTRACAKLDFDQDGLSNNEERICGLDPFIPDFWIRWVQRTSQFYLSPENIINPQLIYRTQCYIGVPLELRNDPISVFINELGPYTYIKDFTLDSQIFYKFLDKIHYSYEIPQSTEKYFIYC